MNKIFSLILVFLLSGSVLAELPVSTAFEIRATGSNNASGGFVWQSLVGGTFTWTASGSGTNEYYCKNGAVACTNEEPNSVACDGFYNLAVKGVLGSLSAGQYGWGDNDSLGFSTLYVRRSDGKDPDLTGSHGAAMSQGVDKSQGGSLVTRTDLGITAGANTQVYSPGTPFTVGDVNNVLRITAGTNFTVGFYQIKAVDANSDALLDAAAGTAGSVNGTGYLGGAFAYGSTLDSEFGALVPIGASIFLAAGTYTIGENIAAGTAGTSTLAVRYVGYSSLRGDGPTGASRPTLAFGSNSITTGANNIYRNIIYTTSHANGISAGSSGRFYNCKFTQATSTQTCLTCTGVVACIGCEFTGAGAYGIKSAGGYPIAIACYFRNLGYGMSCTTGGNYAIQCVFAACATDGLLATTGYQYAVNSVFYGCGVGIESTINSMALVMNTIFSTNTTGAKWNAQNDTGFWRNNIWYNNGTDRTLVFFEPNPITSDPKFKDPANGDFSLLPGSPAYDVGVSIPGLAGTYHYNIGVDQDYRASNQVGIID